MPNRSMQAKAEKLTRQIQAAPRALPDYAGKLCAYHERERDLLVAFATCPVRKVHMRKSVERSSDYKRTRPAIEAAWADYDANEAWPIVRR